MALTLEAVSWTTLIMMEARILQVAYYGSTEIFFYSATFFFQSQWKKSFKFGKPHQWTSVIALKLAAQYSDISESCSGKRSRKLKSEPEML